MEFEEYANKWIPHLQDCMKTGKQPYTTPLTTLSILETMKKNTLISQKNYEKYKNQWCHSLLQYKD